MKSDGEPRTLISLSDFDELEGTGDSGREYSGEGYSGTRRGDVVGVARRALDSEEVLMGRFRVEELVQSGGMGDVYRALDLLTDSVVALKTLRSGAANQERFEREAERLAELQHSGIPGYIDHGVSPDGIPFLAMEWLDGVDLGDYLRRNRLGIQSSVRMLKMIAETVAVAHSQGVIHRDINPSNLFLVRSQIDDVRVLDFGVARLVGEQPALTCEGTQIGTPGYMAPEQIEGRREVGPAADVFALGCVLYETLVGQRAFYAPTIKELLARMLSEMPPAPSELHRGVPPELDELVLHCLNKDPEHRPKNAAALVQLLNELPELSDEAPSEARPGLPGNSEQQLTSMVVLRAVGEGVFERASRACESFGMHATRGTDDTIVIATRGSGTAADHAALAARCALAVQRATRASHLSVSTGLARKVGEFLAGRAFDAALVSLLMKDGDNPEEGRAGTCLWLDENTAGLLDSRFDVRAVEEGFLLRGMRETYEPARTVLGRKTRCFGRRREISTLEATLAECFEDGIASSVLITGPPGIGKSRLAGEISRIARQKVPGVQILRGGADAMKAGAPLTAIARAVARACRIDESSPDSVRRSRLHERLETLIPKEDLGRVSEFLAELLGVPVATGVSRQMEAARRDAILRGDQIHRALTDWLRGECVMAPVLLILEDFQWGDLPTVKFIDWALRSLSESPLVVLTLARPEVHELFPKLWVRRGVTEIRLNHLSRRAATEMVTEVLGEDVAPHVVERVVRRAQGNPYWIEELLRAEDAGQGEDVPDRIVLLAQSRISQQSPDERKLLKAGSVFGGQFWEAGAKAVLSGEGTTRPLNSLLRDLIENEFIFEHELSALGGQREFQFASGLLRDAAYSLLGEEEKEQAHLRAASWLERSGDSDPLAVAMHFTLGGEVEKARSHYLLAAEQALSGDDLDAAISCAEEGLAAGARGPDFVRLSLVLAEAHRWRGDNSGAFRSAQKAFARAEEGSSSWYRAAAEAAVAAGKIGKDESSLAIAKELLESSPAFDALADHGCALSRVATQLVLSTKTELARELLRAVVAGDTRLEPDPHVMGHYHEALAVLSGADGDPVKRISETETAIQNFEDAGDLRHATLARLSKGFAEVEFGANDDALVTLNRALEVSRHMDLDNSIPIARAQLGRALGRKGKVDEAIEHLHAALAGFDRQKNLRLSGMGRLYLAELHLVTENVDAAQSATRRAMHILSPLPPLLRIAQAMSAAITSIDFEGSQVEAEFLIDAAISGLTPDTRLPFSESMMRVCAASALSQLGRQKEAADLINQEVKRVEGLVQQMTPERTEQFLTGDPARAYLIGLDEKTKNTPSGIHFLRWLTMSKSLASVNTVLETQEVRTLARLERLVRQPEPTLSTFRVSESYHNLSDEIAAVIDRQNLNWSTFAGWASKSAAIALVEEQLPCFARVSLGLEETKLPMVHGVYPKVLKLLGLTRLIGTAALATLKEVSQEFTLNAQAVHTELAPLFARFIDLMRTNPGSEDVSWFTGSLREGSVESGGQDLLKRAFLAWFEASRTESNSLRAQLILRANCQIAQHQQTKLQRTIQDAMEAPIEQIMERRISNALPRLFRAPMAWFISQMTQGLVVALRAFWKSAAPRYSMRLSLPGGRESFLVDEGPFDLRPYPPDLQKLTDPKTEALFDFYERYRAPDRSSRDSDWSQLSDRMGFIVHFFRSEQQNLELFGPLFTELEEKSLSLGTVPEELAKD